MATQSQSSRHWKLRLASFISIGKALARVVVLSSITSCSDFALAQVTPDTTLGAEQSVVTPDVINSVPSHRIDGGAIRGDNLFHSLHQLNVSAEQGVYFSNPPGIKNILSRVTGNEPSKILGRLGVLEGNANLFLINPNGIIFGPNASLDLRGSFIASTATSINFADGTQFSAKAPQSAALLTISVPIGLQFKATPGSILSQSQASPNTEINSLGYPVGLQVQSGKTLALVGGDVTLSGGNLTAAGGRIELGSVGIDSLVGVNQTQKGWSLRYDSVQNFQNIQIIQRTVNGFEIQSLVDATGAEGAEIQVQGRHVILNGGSQILATNQGSKPGGNVILNASDSVELNGTSPDGAFSGLITATSGSADAGNITVTTKRLLIRDGAGITTEASGEQLFDQFIPATGRAGSLIVNASESLELIEGKLIAETVSGEGGNITLHSQQVQLRRQSNISTTAGIEGSPGNGGNIMINTGTLVGLENSDITANAFEGKGGMIEIKARGVFGLLQRNLEDLKTLFKTDDPSKLNPQQLLTSDITAISQTNPSLSGQVIIQTPDVDPSRGLVALPVEPVNIAALITQNCPVDRGQENSFTITGRGGLPPNPSDMLSSDTIWTDLRPSKSAGAAVHIQPTKSTPEQLVEAQGWVINHKGEVVLTASAPNVTPLIPWITPASCHGSV